MGRTSAVVVGTGFIGPVHVEALRRAGVHVAGIVGSNPEKSKAAAEQLGLEPRFGTLDEVLSAGDVASVHLTTPNRFHFDQASRALAAGKHVLCEKPLAMTSAETQELTELADKSDRITAVAYNVRYYPLNHEAAARVQSSDLGSILHVNGSYVQDWLLSPYDFNWRVLASEGGALRAVADIGTHWLDLLQYITGQKIVRVFADLQTVHATRHRPIGGAETFTGARKPNETQPIDIDTEDAGTVLLRFEGGGHGSVRVSQTTAGRKNCLQYEIASEGGALAWNSESPNTLFCGRRDQPNEHLIRDPALMAGPAAGVANYPGGHNEGFPDTFKQLCIDFYRQVENGRDAKSALPTFADGHREVRLCEAILESHRTESWVDV